MWMGFLIERYVLRQIGVETYCDSKNEHLMRLKGGHTEFTGSAIGRCQRAGRTKDWE